VVRSRRDQQLMNSSDRPVGIRAQVRSAGEPDEGHVELQAMAREAEPGGASVSSMGGVPQYIIPTANLF
jgi:hypothetical protein